MAGEAEDDQVPTGPNFDVKAIVRIRIPLKRDPEPEEDEAT